MHPRCSMNRSTVLFSAFLATLQGASYAADCYNFPGDASWPSESTWSELNSTISGRLVATIPIGSPCHDPTYDEAACTALQNGWTNPLTHIPSSSSVMTAYFANNSCDPFTDRTLPCTLGHYVDYAVNVSSVADIQSGLDFARTNNIRTVVRNTGHDFLGRSTGAGSLGIWTNHLKDISFLSWPRNYSDSSDYTGPAARVGAGVLGYEILAAAQAANLTVVSGECPTVGLAGGFTQGGGHSALSTSFGLAADQVLEYEVVTASGEFLTASPTLNSDLYWALSGGGGGTFGIVTALTVRAYKSESIGGAAVTILAATTTPDNFNAAVEDFHTALPAMVDAGLSVVYLLTSQFLILKTVTAYNSSGTAVASTLAPFLANLVSRAIVPITSFTTLSYYDHFNTYLGPLPQGNLEVAKYTFGGRLIPRDVFTDESKLATYSTALQNLTASGLIIAGSAANYARRANTPANAVLPAWRDSLVQTQLLTTWDTAASFESNVALQVKMNEEWMPIIRAATPGAGAYMNEADFRSAEWKEEFFGSNYDRLEAVKAKYDPEGVFYVLKGVGSEQWVEVEEGRLCRA